MPPRAHTTYVRRCWVLTHKSTWRGKNTYRVHTARTTLFAVFFSRSLFSSTIYHKRLSKNGKLLVPIYSDRVGIGTTSKMQRLFWLVRILCVLSDENSWEIVCAASQHKESASSFLKINNILISHCKIVPVGVISHA